MLSEKVTHLKTETGPLVEKSHTDGRHKKRIVVKPLNDSSLRTESNMPPHYRKKKK